MRLKLKYVIEDVDRHGNVRVYYRPPGHTKIRLHEKVGTPEFLRELGGVDGFDQDECCCDGDECPEVARCFLAA